MSHVIKGFCIVNEMTDKVMGNIAPVGELSSYSETFSTTKNYVAKPEYENVSAVIFSCKEDGVTKNMPETTDTYLLAILEDIVTVFAFNIEFAPQFNSRYPAATLISVGDMISVPGKYYPSYLTWDAVVDSEPTRFTIWFSDAAFRVGYDEYEIRVLPPIPNPNDLGNTHSVLLDLLENYEYAEKVSALEEARNNDPATKIATVKIKWTQPNTSLYIHLTWTLVTFGPAGLLYDNQLKAIRDYLFKETGKTPDEWLDNIPELILQATITILPIWDNVALRSSGSIEYIHSPLIFHSDYNRVALKRYPNGPTNEELAKLVYGVIQYKSIGFLAFPEPNSGENTLFNQLYPDYALINFNDINLNRLSLITRTAMQAIEKGIRLAEIDVAGAPIPLDFQRQTVANRSYLSYVVDGVTHRILTKASFLTE